LRSVGALLHLSASESATLKGPTALIPVRAIGDRHRSSIGHCRSTLQRLVCNIKGEDILGSFVALPNFAVHRTNLQRFLIRAPLPRMRTRDERLLWVGAGTTISAGRSGARRHQTSKWLVGVAQKAHIRSTTQVILSDTETTSRGVLCLAPIGRLACMTTRSSRSCCSVLRSIRQSNNVNESCIKKAALKTARTATSGPFGQSGWQAGTVRAFVQPASNPSTA
jgi:hypothetical protein